MKRLVNLGFLAACICATTAAAAAQTPLVVAVDTSRSLTTSDLEQIRQDVAAVLEQVPADTPVGLITFNDSAQWLSPVDTDRDSLAQALQNMRPTGNYTVFHDALFLAVRRLQDGGVILVATDGRDENSATTVDDVARLCDEHHTRILSTGIGRTVDERSLRRFALLSNGEYLGRLRQLDPAVAAQAIAEAQRGVATDIEDDLPPQPAAAPTPVQIVTERVEVPSAAVPTWFFVVLAVVLIALVVWFFTRSRGSAPTGKRLCEVCDTPLEPWETSCSNCEMAKLEDAVNSTNVAEAAVQDESVLDPAVFEKSPVPAGLDQTLVLDEQPVLVTKQRGKPPRTYSLPKEQIFAVGRAPKVNTLTIDDPTISGQHFKVVPKEGEYYVVDLETTNGTSVNHERVKVRKLAPGDVIRVGMVEFEFMMKIRRVS